MALYSDDSTHCFGCGFHERGSHNPWTTECIAIKHPDVGAEENPVIRSPDDSCTTFGETSIQYLSSCKVGVLEAIRRGLRYSPSREQLLYPYYNEEGILKCLQARNFNKSRSEKAKYHNQGSPAEVLPIYRSTDGLHKTLVITEDALSAIRIARQCDAMPALGTYVPVKKLTALMGAYGFIIVWLDRDKLREARHIADNCTWLGLSARTIYTELDPKAYENEEITQYLKL